MRSYKVLMLCFAAAWMSSCRGVPDELPAVVVSGGTDGTSRTALVLGAETTSIYWSEGDRIGIFCGENVNLCYVADGSGPATTFTAAGSPLRAVDGTVRAYYPYSEANCSEEEAVAEVPYFQTIDVSGVTVVPMYSYNDARIVSGHVDLRFRSLFPILGIGLKGAGLRVAMIVAEPAGDGDGCRLAGSYAVDLASGRRVAQSLSRRITVRLHDGEQEFVTLGDTETWVEIPVVPFFAAEGLRLTIVSADGRRFVKRIWAGGGGVNDGEHLSQPLKAMSESDFKVPDETVVTRYDFNSTAYKVASGMTGEALYRTGPDGAQWVFYHGSPSGTATARSLKLSYFVSCKHPGWVYADFVMDNVTEIGFQAQHNTGNCKGVLVQISTDGGSSWSEGEVYALSTTARSYKYYPSTDSSVAPEDGDMGVNGVMIRFTVVMSSLTRSNAEVTLDDIVVTGRY